MDEDFIQQSEADGLCEAASAVYFHLARCKARELGVPVVLPDLLGPKGRIRCVSEFDVDAIEAAERFLLRLGVIARRAPPTVSEMHDLS